MKEFLEAIDNILLYLHFMKLFWSVFYLLVAFLLLGKIAITVLNPQIAAIQYAIPSDMEESSGEDDTESLDDDEALTEIGSFILYQCSKVSFFQPLALNIPGLFPEIVSPPPQA